MHKGSKLLLLNSILLYVPLSKADGGIGAIGELASATFYWFSFVLFTVFIGKNIIVRNKEQGIRNSIPEMLIILFYLPIYLVFLPKEMINFSSYAYSQNFWLMLLHIILAFLTIKPLLCKKFVPLFRLLCVSFFVLLVVLSPNVTLYQYNEVDNQPLDNPQKVLLDYQNGIIELSDGFYKETIDNSKSLSGEIISLEKTGTDAFNVYVKANLYTKTQFSIKLPIIPKNIDKYTKKHIGTIRKITKPLELKVDSEILRSFYCTEEHCSYYELQRLLQLGADPNVISPLGSPLVKVVRKGEPRHVRLLFEYGANVNDKSLPVLGVFSNNKNGAEILELLINQGVVIPEHFWIVLKTLEDRSLAKQINSILSKYKIQPHK